VPEACPRTDLGLRLRGELLIDTPDFYGVVTVGTTLRGRWRFRDRWVVSLALDPATFRLAVNAVVTGSGVGVGPATVGVQRMFRLRQVAVSPYARLLLPLDSARHQGALWGGELGAAAAWRGGSKLSLRGGLAAPATLAMVGGHGHGALRPGGLAEAVYAPRAWIALAAGVAVRAQVSPPAHLLAVAPRLGADLLTRRGWRFGLGLDRAVAGDDRTDLTVALFAGWTPGPAPR
jgi:hypothetical protein